MNKDQIQDRINEILQDERIYYKTATVFENAPLGYCRWWDIIPPMFN